jgi:hypothetical protein
MHAAANVAVLRLRAKLFHVRASSRRHVNEHAHRLAIVRRGASAISPHVRNARFVRRVLLFELTLLTTQSPRDEFPKNFMDHNSSSSSALPNEKLARCVSFLRLYAVATTLALAAVAWPRFTRASPPS